MQVVHENKIVKAVYYPESGIIRFKWTGLIVSDLIKEALEKTMPFIVAHKTLAFVHDSIECRGTFSSVNGWLNSVIIPHMLANGVKCYSIATTDVFSRFAGNALISLTKNKMKGKIFANVADSERWVHEILSSKN